MLDEIEGYSRELILELQTLDWYVGASHSHAGPILLLSRRDVELGVSQISMASRLKGRETDTKEKRKEHDDTRIHKGISIHKIWMTYGAKRINQNTSQ